MSGNGMKKNNSKPGSAAESSGHRSQSAPVQPSGSSGHRSQSIPAQPPGYSGHRSQSASAQPPGSSGRFSRFSGRSAMGAHGTGESEKAQDFKKSWGQLIRYAKKYATAVIVALHISAIGTVFSFIGPDRLRAMTDEIVKGLPALADGQPVIGAIDMSAVFNIGMVLVFFYGSAAILGFVGNYILVTISAIVSKNMRADISRKINKMPLKYFDKASYGDLISRVTNDVDAIGQTLSQSLDTLVRAVTMFVGSGFMMFYTNVTMALTAVGASLIGFALMTVTMKISQKHFNAQQKGLGDINGHIEEVYSGHNVVKVYNGGKDARRTFEGINATLYESGWKSQFLSGLMMPMMMFIGNLSYVAVCVMGAVLAMNGTISFGVIVAFMIYIRLFTQPLSQLAQAVQPLQRTAAAGERVFEFLEEEELED